MKILIAPDKFKGSLTARDAANAIARGIKHVWPDAELTLCPIADGGEGTAHALSTALNAEWIARTVEGPLGAPVEAGYYWAPDSGTAIVEMCAASGLHLVPPEARLPREASTYGTGELIKDAIQRGAKRIIVGLGGSATTDGGAGMAAALGYEFYTSDGEIMERPTPANLLALIRIKGEEAPEFPEIIAACDVQNPLLGETGTARVFAPQKGADANDIQALDWALENLAEIAADDLQRDFRNEPGAGAAGGLGFGLLTFCGAKIRSGFELIAEVLELDKAVAAADLIVTGEGSVDFQTLHGKGPAGIAALAKAAGKPVICFGGRVQHCPELLSCFDAVIPIANEPMPVSEAMAAAETLLEQSGERAARLIAVGLRRP